MHDFPHVDLNWILQEQSSGRSDSGQKSSGQSSQQTIPYTGEPSHEYSDSVSPATPPQRTAMPTPAPAILYSSDPAPPAAMPAPDPVVPPKLDLPTSMQHVPASAQPHIAPGHEASDAQPPPMPWRSGGRQPADHLAESLPQRPPRRPKSSHSSGLGTARAALPRPHAGHQTTPQPHQKTPRTKLHAHAPDLPASDPVPGAVSPKASDIDNFRQGAQQNVAGEASRRTPADTEQGSKGVLERTEPAEKGLREQRKSAQKTDQQEDGHELQESPARNGSMLAQAAPAAKSTDGKNIQRRRPSVQQPLQRQTPPARSRAVTTQTDSPIHGVVLPEGSESAPLLLKGVPVEGKAPVLQRPQDHSKVTSAQSDSQNRSTTWLPKTGYGVSNGSAPYKTSAGSSGDDLASELPGLSSSHRPRDAGSLKDADETAGDTKIGAWRPKRGAAEDAGPRAGQNKSTMMVWEPVKQPPWLQLEGGKTSSHVSQAQQANERGSPNMTASGSTAVHMAEHKPSQAKEHGDGDPDSSTSRVYLRAGDLTMCMSMWCRLITATHAAHHVQLVMWECASTVIVTAWP